MAELQQAGEEVFLSPELIQQAYEKVKIQRKQAEVKRKRLIQSLAIVDFITTLWGVLTYNSLNGQLQVEAAWAQVENQLQRKIDLIPQLIELTNARAKAEQKAIKQLVESRQAYLQADSNSAKIEAIALVNSALKNWRSQLKTDRQLQSSQVFINLQYEITGTENRLATERRRYNQAVQVYEQKIGSFPNNLAAKVMGFESIQYYQSKL